MKLLMFRGISIILIIVLFSGCWDRREVEDLAIVSAIGLDLVTVRGIQKYRLTVQVVRPQALGKIQGGGEKSGNPVWVKTSIGNSINEAVRNFSSQSPRQLFLAHAKIAVFGSSMADHGLHEVLDFFQRQREIRLRTWLVVTPGEALELLKVKPIMETLPSTEIVGLFTNTQPQLSKSYPIDLKEFLSQVADRGKDPVVSVVTLNPYGPNDDIPKENDSSKDFPRLQGLAVFRGGKKVGYLGDVETMGFLWTTGKMKRSLITLPSKNKNEYEVAIEVTNADSRIVPIIHEDKVIIKVEIKAEGDLGEHLKSGPVLNKLPAYEAKFNQVIKEQAIRTIKKAQSTKYRADIFGFGDSIHRKYPELWRRYYRDTWNTKEFPQLEVIVQVKAKIRRTGMITNSVPFR